MAYRVEDLLQECSKTINGGAGDTSKAARRSRLFNMSMPGLSLTTFDGVWNSVLQCIRSNMKMKRGTRLPSFGRVVFAKGTKTPFFVMNEGFSQPSKIKFRQDIKAPELPSVDLNFSKIGQLAKCTKDVAKSIYRELVSRIGEVVSDANNTVHIVFKGIGALHGTRFDLRFTFGSGGPGGKMSRPASVASFTKNAPATASGLAILSGVAGAGAGGAVPQISSRSERPSARMTPLGASASVPSLRKGLAVSTGIRDSQPQQSRRSQRSQRSQRSRQSSSRQQQQRQQQQQKQQQQQAPGTLTKKGLPLNSLVAKKGHEPSYLSTDQLKDLNLRL